MVDIDGERAQDDFRSGKTSEVGVMRSDERAFDEVRLERLSLGCG